MVKLPHPLTVLETCLYVSDLDEAREFYQGVMGLERHSGLEGRHEFFRCGDGMVLLFRPEASAASKEVPAHGAVGAGHIAFRIEPEQLSEWREYLKQQGIEIEHEHRWPSGGSSLYFRDPAGNSLELATSTTWKN